MNCKNCSCPLEGNSRVLCSFCQEQQNAEDELEIQEYEDQLKKARKAGVPIDKIHEVLQVIYFE